MAFKSALLASMILGISSPAMAIPAPASIRAADTFRLAINVTSFDLTPSIQGKEVIYDQTADCQANLLLGDASTGALFTSTTDNVGVASFDGVFLGMVVTPGGTATVPSTNVVKVQCGSGTPGVVLEPEVGVEYDGGSWMACPGSVLGLDDKEPVFLSYKKAGQRTLLGCADVQLLPTSSS